MSLVLKQSEKEEIKNLMVNYMRNYSRSLSEASYILEDSKKINDDTDFFIREAEVYQKAMQFFLYFYDNTIIDYNIHKDFWNNGTITREEIFDALEQYLSSELCNKIAKYVEAHNYSSDSDSD